MAAYPDLSDRPVIMRTSGGTRVVVRSLRSGADPVYAASLVVARATAHAVRRFSHITLVASGLGGISIADEDEETGGLLSDRILELPDDPYRIDRIRRGEGAKRLASTAWIDPADLERCLDTDRFDFALRAVITDGIPSLRAEPARESATPRKYDP